MKKIFFTCLILICMTPVIYGQKVPTGNPQDFKVKTCLHSIGYSGLWRGIALHHDAMYWLLKEINLPNVMAGWDAWSPTLEGLSKEEIR